MSTAGVRTAPAGRVRGLGRRSLGIAIPLAVVMTLSFVVRLRLITHGAGIAASDGYDDGVYYAAADALVHGRLPYRDFLLLHPPGITIVLAPFAALGALLGDQIGVTAARIAFLLIGAMNTGLIAVIALRHSRTAGVVAGIGAAVFFPLAYSERSTLLEPVGTALLLWSVIALQRHRTPRGLVIAGVLAGCSIDVKIWYVVPVLLLGVLMAPHRRLFLAGAAAGGAAIALPFFAAAPVAMFREIVADQLGRPGSAGSTSLIRRLSAIGSAPKAVHPLIAHQAGLLAAAVLIVLAIAAVGAWRVRWARAFVVLAVCTGGVLLVSPSFFPHYVGFVAPWMLLVLGIGVAALTGTIRRRPLRLVAAALPLALVVAVDVPTDLRARVVPQPVAALHAAMAGRSGCIVSDDPGLLANAGLLSTDLARRCPLWPDVTGWTYDRDRLFAGDRVVPRQHNLLWQRDLMRYLTSGDDVVLNRSATGLSSADLAELEEGRVIARAGALRVYAVRD